jgi:hypothetical protein
VIAELAGSGIMWSRPNSEMLLERLRKITKTDRLDKHCPGRNSKLGCPNLKFITVTPTSSARFGVMTEFIIGRGPAN